MKVLTSARLSPILSTLVIACLASVASAQDDSLTLTKTISARQQKSAAQYWTRERIAAAPALPMPVDKGLAVPDVALPQEEEAMVRASSTPAGMADPDADRIARAYYAQDWAALDEESAAPDAEALVNEPKGTAGVYTYYDVNTQTALWQIYPHKWSGKLTFTTATGGASCSATSISGNNIVTAAHCVYDSTANRWYSNWVFTPAYRNGSAPYGTFTASACTVLTAWANLTGSFSINSWTRHDVAVCSLNNNSAGQIVNQAVGWAGRLWNASSTQLVFVNGYPARIYTDASIPSGAAQYLRSCTAETRTQATDTLGAGCYWSRGASGGSWLVGYKPFVVTGNVNSVYSGFFIGAQNAYGARFTSNNIVPVCNTRHC